MFRASGDSKLEVSTLSTAEPLPLRGYVVDGVAMIGNPLEPQTSKIDVIPLESLINAAIQSVNPEGLLRILQQQCTQSL